MTCLIIIITITWCLNLDSIRVNTIMFLLNYNTCLILPGPFRFKINNNCEGPSSKIVKWDFRYHPNHFLLFISYIVIWNRFYITRWSPCSTISSCQVFRQQNIPIMLLCQTFINLAIHKTLSQMSHLYVFVCLHFQTVCPTVLGSDRASNSVWLSLSLVLQYISDYRY